MANKFTVETIMKVPIHAFIKPRLVREDRAEKSATIGFTTRKDLLTPAETLNANALYIAFEISNIIACIPNLSEGEKPITVSHHIHMIGNVSGEGNEIEVKSTMIKRGKTIAFFESEARVAETGVLLSTCRTVKSFAQPKVKESKL